MGRSDEKSNNQGLAVVTLREAGDLRLALGVLREPFAWWVMAVSLAMLLPDFFLLQPGSLR